MARRAAATDVLIALALGVEMQVELFFVDASSRDLLIARVTMLVLAVAVAIRRRAPIVAGVTAILAVTVLERLANDLSDGLTGPFFVVLFLCYSVGAHTDGRRLALGVTLLLILAVVSVRIDQPPGGADDLFFVATIIIGGPVLLGRLVRSRVRLGQALREKTVAMERDREERAAAAVADERARIAGELHHLVSDALASMVGQAGAAERLVRSRPDVAESAFASIESNGREALDELRQMLGVLRHEDAELALAPQPSLAHVADLIARVRASGLPVALEVEGEPSPLPAGVDLTAYRVVQEALAGALESKDSRSAAVRLRYAADQVLLEVTDVGPAAPERSLLGIHERVELYGGHLVTESLGESGYAVRARLPVERAE
jgi:signal transduction histidine kinase